MSSDPKNNEFGLAVSAWTEVLYGFVPADKLEESYLTAMRSRKSTFPLGASEICAAYKEGARPSFMAAEKSKAEMEAKHREAQEFEANIERMEAERDKSTA